MPRATHEKNQKVYFVPAIADIAAPTMTEIGAGKNLTPHVTKDGIQPNMTESKVNNASIDTAFNAQSIGSWGAEFALTFYRDDTDESETYDLLTRGTLGFIVNSPFGPAEPGKKVAVYPVEVGITMLPNSAENENQKFTVNFAVTDEPNLRAVVAVS